MLLVRFSFKMEHTNARHRWGQHKYKYDASYCQSWHVSYAIFRPEPLIRILSSTQYLHNFENLFAAYIMSFTTCEHQNIINSASKCATLHALDSGN
jgi:hypothetical protein